LYIITLFVFFIFFFFSSRRRHTRWPRDWSSDVCSSDLSTPVQELCVQLRATDWLRVWRELWPILFPQRQHFGASPRCHRVKTPRSEERRVGERKGTERGGGGCREKEM